MSLRTPSVVRRSTALPRPAALRPGSLCFICDAGFARRMHGAKASFTTHISRKSKASLPRRANIRPPPTRECLRSQTTAASAVSNEHAAEGRLGEDRANRSSSRTIRTSGQEFASLTNMMAYIENSKTKALKRGALPSEQDVSTALQACRVVAEYIMDDSVQPQISHLVNDTNSSASNLLSLDAAGRKTEQVSQQTPSEGTKGVQVSAQVKQMVDDISQAAWELVAHQNVFISPSLLRQYVLVQSALGKPDTLPRVLRLYSSKPLPRETSGSIQYEEQNPNKAANAVDPEVLGTALDTAIDAKNLDAAVGVIENGYTTTAFVRSKLLRRALVPGITFAATPPAAYALARSFSVFQDAMDVATATNVAFAGILAYVGFTASIGVVAVTTANDQMRRVTWAPGVPLRKRWIREEERAALDKVACAWGFREKWRQGEEEGVEWDALREYIGQKGMVLDRTELMDGMQ